jgi:hypothetical protein
MNISLARPNQVAAFNVYVQIAMERQGPKNRKDEICPHSPFFQNPQDTKPDIPTSLLASPLFQEARTLLIPRGLTSIKESAFER